jgi:hypothetical protein
MRTGDRGGCYSNSKYSFITPVFYTKSCKVNRLYFNLNQCNL